MPNYQCDVCKRSFVRSDYLKKHLGTHSSSERYVCHTCGYATPRRDTLKRHVKYRHSFQAVGPPEKRPRAVSDSHENYPRQSFHDKDISLEPRSDVSAFEQLINAHRARIRTYTKRGKRHQDLYNFQLETGSLPELMGYLRLLFSQQEHMFKLNLSFGFILKNYFTDELIYYYASNNHRLFEKPVTIKEAADLSKVSDKIDRQDLLEYARSQRPNTSYVVVRITNVNFYVDKLKHYNIGSCSGTELPNFILQKRCLIAFHKNSNGVEYNDRMCFFRCLAYHLNNSLTGIDVAAHELLAQYCQGANRRVQNFSGVQLKELPSIEKVFEVNVDVFSLEESVDESEEDDAPRLLSARKIQTSQKSFPGPTMNVNLFDCHFSYIKDLNVYCRRWHCAKCDKLFNKLFNCRVHERSCTSRTRYIFPGGGYGQKKTIFDALQENGIDVPSDMRYYPYRLAFDFECLFERTYDEQGNAPDSQQGSSFVNRLVPASVSICSNVPGFTEPQCFISSGNPAALIETMYAYMVSISNKSFALLKELYKDILAAICEKIERRQLLITERGIALAADKEDEAALLDAEAYRLKAFEKLQADLESWLRRLVCLGFNTGKFDFNLIRKYLFPYFLNNNVDVNYIIKKNNDYLSITTPHCVFLDIKNYLAAGTSYKKWLDSYAIEQTKGWFPYEWFTDLEKLHQTSLPPQAAFWSSLKQAGIADGDYLLLQVIWKTKGFQTMHDLLAWYNNLDVQPFLTAAQKLFDYWISLGIDPFKGHAISLPGLALCYLTANMQPHTILPLFRPMHEHLYHMIRDNVVGGLSYVAHRYHERGVTRLPNGELVQWIYSHDSNSLYLWAFGEPTGTGIYYVWTTKDSGTPTLKWTRRSPNDLEVDVDRRRKQCNEIRHHNMGLQFVRTSSYTYGKKELEWLEWMIHTTGKDIEHKFNGRQKTIIFDRDSRFPVDGFLPSDSTILQFHGCYFHGHGCRWDTNKTDVRNDKRDRTDKVTAKLRSLGYTVIEKWECEWDAEKRANLQINQFIESEFGLAVKQNVLSAGAIVEAIQENKIFGMVECDIEVPDTDSTLLAYFEEFPAICKNTEISLDDVGNHMRTYANENGYMRRPRRNLISSHWARKILLTTPMIRWLLSRGLVITRLYSVLEMKPKQCFAHIRDNIAHQRRLADADPAYKPTGESWKTLGNSLYGKAMTNKEKHKDCKLVGDSKVFFSINNPRFHSMEEVGDIAYEVSMDKTEIKQDLPLTLAFFVYNYAKLRMLEFVYDFLKKYLRPGSYQIVCSDTDSIIAAYASRDIDSLVKPELWNEYITVGKPSFLATDQYTARTPGLFKVELGATGIVALCSKTYFAWNDEENSTKVSSKGLSKKTNRFGKETFMNVLASKEKGSGVNHGFVVKRDELFQYRQKRYGLPYLYVKRRVMDDGISTTSLDL